MEDIRIIGRDLSAIVSKIEDCDRDVNTLRSENISRCKIALRKVLNREFEFGSVIIFGKKFEITDISLSDEGKLVVKYIDCLSLEDGAERSVLLEELPYDAVISITKSVCKLFLEEVPQESDKDRLTSMLIECFDNEDNDILYIGDLFLTYGDKSIMYVARVGRQIHFYDDDPYGSRVVEVVVADEKEWCEIVNEIVCSIG